MGSERAREMVYETCTGYIKKKRAWRIFISLSADQLISGVSPCTLASEPAVNVETSLGLDHTKRCGGHEVG